MTKRTKKAAGTPKRPRKPKTSSAPGEAAGAHQILKEALAAADAEADPYGDHEWLAKKRTEDLTPVQRKAGATHKPKTLDEEEAEEKAKARAAVEATREALEVPHIHEPPARRGRPSEFKPEYVAQAEKLCALGATDAEIADFFEVEERTIYRWKHTHPDFCQALKAGKEMADERVERTLYRRAIGYQVEAVKIFMPAGASEPIYAKYMESVQPDTTAAIFWLKNRRPELWRDKREVTHSGAIGRAVDLTDDQLAAIIAASSGGTAGEEKGADEPDRVH